MKKYWFAALLLFNTLLLFSQDYLQGKMTDDKTTGTEIFYDRTQYSIGNGIFMSVYKVFDKNKSLLYTFSLTHDRTKSLFFVSTKIGTRPATAVTIRYERDKCGLIFNNFNNLDTAFNIAKRYNYLISFTDTMREYPVLHKIKTERGEEFTLDPLTKIRIRKHKELIKKMSGKISVGTETRVETEEEKEEAEKFSAQLFEAKDSFHSKNAYYSATIGRMRNQVEKNVSAMMKGKKVSEDLVKYSGEKKRGSPHGLGLYVSNGNYYDGNFSEGKFVSGTVILKNEAYEYCGGFNEGRKNGIGWLKYRNGNFDMGVFQNDALLNGASLDNNPKGEVFFGSLKDGQRTGYGELRNQAGSKYCGEFVAGRLVKGYAKEVDPFGFTSYSRIDNAIKTPVDSTSLESVLNSLLQGN